MTKSIALLPLALLLLSAPAPAQPPEPDLRRHPGFVDLGDTTVFDDDRLKVHVSVKDAMLRLVAAAARESEPELAEMIAGLEAVEVRAFDVDDTSQEAVAALITETAGKLKRLGWDPAIDVRLEGSQGFLYFRFDGDTPIGLAAMFLDQGGEAMFVNIVGTIDPTLIGKLAARFNLTLLGEALPGEGDAASDPPAPPDPP